MYRYRFGGKELSGDLGLYDYGARNYDPATGRWLQVDPLVETMSSWSPYNYTFNDPIKHSDPDGRNPIIGGIVGAVLDYGTQVAINYATGNESPWTDVSTASIGGSFVGGMVGAGLVSNANKLANLAKAGNRLSHANSVKIVGEVSGDVLGSATQQYIATGEVDPVSVGVAVLVGQTVRTPVRDKVANGRQATQSQLNEAANAAEEVAVRAQNRVSIANVGSSSTRRATAARNQARANAATQEAATRQAAAATYSRNSVYVVGATGAASSGAVNRLLSHGMPSAMLPTQQDSQR